ncbi:MAG: hypothetical protein WDO56_07980 [Gammaproteobacteria bacterium]
MDTDWDENLLQGLPPNTPVPEVGGITVHLTFCPARIRAGCMVQSAGSIIVMGGLHGLSCPDEVRPHADTIAIGDGVQLWPQILEDIEGRELKPMYSADYKLGYLAMSYLYKRSKLIWHLLIRHRLTTRVWQPLVEHARRRHLAYRLRLEALPDFDNQPRRATNVVSAGV